MTTAEYRALGKYRIWELTKRVGRLNCDLGSDSEKTTHDLMSTLGTFPGDIDLERPVDPNGPDLIANISDSGRIVIHPGKDRRILGMGCKDSDEYDWKPKYATRDVMMFDYKPKPSQAFNFGSREVTFYYNPNTDESII